MIGTRRFAARAGRLGMALALLAAPDPALAQGSGQGAMSEVRRALAQAARLAAEPDALTASYSGALDFSSPGTRIRAGVRFGKVQCTGTTNTGDRVITHDGAGKIDLELGVGGTSESGQTLRDQYRITLHCPSSNAPPDRSLGDIANTAYQPGGRVTLTSTGLVGPELLKGEWRANGEVFSWHLCKSNCRPPGP